ncbi:MAG: glycosyltransferase [Desulfovibrio sp.]|nr:glycosyltransferase [Desulfovibrio sp.]
MTFTTKKIAVVLPAYNEELTVGKTIEGFYQALPQAAIWVVNNRSSDKTESVAKETMARLGCTGGVINEPRPGKGCAVRRAFMEIEADVYLLADADMTYPASQAQELLAPVLAGEADMVVGDRHCEGDYASENKRAFHNVGNILVRKLVNGLFQARLSDILSGYRAFSRRFVKTYPILVDGFEIETDVTLHALDKRMTILEIPVRYKDRPPDSFSKLSTMRDGMRVIFVIGKILRYYKPLRFFFSAALIAAISGLLAGWPVLQEYFNTGYVSHVPLAILASGCEVVALLLASVGLILDTIAHQERARFERELLSRTYKNPCGLPRE